MKMNKSIALLTIIAGFFFWTHSVYCSGLINSARTESPSGPPKGY